VAGVDLRRPTFSLIALVAANLVPLAGVLFLGWDAAMILLLYWSENLVIGAFNVLKMILVQPRSRVGWAGKLFMVPFFCVHFGGFCAVHGLFLLLLLGLGGEDAMTPTSAGTAWPGPLIFVQLLVGVVAHAWNVRPEGSTWPLLALAAGHGISFVQNYLGKLEYETLNLERLMGAPYGRIAVLQVAILAGAAPILALHSPVPMLCALVVLKIVMDVKLHARSHRSREVPAGAEAVS
jgi:hypothetical protein